MRTLNLAGPRGLDLAQGQGHSEGLAVTPICNPLLNHHQTGCHRGALRRSQRYVGDLPPMPRISPDYPAPVVRNSGSEREMTMMR
jgi:hypothetical protein